MARGMRSDTWQSSNPKIAKVDTTVGVTTVNITTVSVGTDTINHITGTDTTLIRVIVASKPSAIFGQLDICTNASVTLNDTSGQGTWASSLTSVAAIGTTTGTVTAIAAGTSTITFSISASCYTTATLHVYTTPPAISGDAQVNINGHKILSDSVAGGVWKLSDNSLAVFAQLTPAYGSAIELFGVSKGIDTLTYTTCNGNTKRIVTIDSGKIAVQSTKFFGAVYSNYTNIQDDDPANFTQYYARLSQPLNKGEGIDKSAKLGKRFIFLRNLAFQITYGNTDNFKLYTADFFNNRNVNRLDLLSHAYFNGTVDANIFTFVIPKIWKQHSGDMGHIYLDIMSSLAVTNVIDSFPTATGNTNPMNTNSNNQVYNIKSNIWGLNLKGHFNGVFNKNLNVDGGAKLFYVFPSSKIISPDLSPQSSDLSSYNSDSIYKYTTKTQISTLNSFLTTGKNVIPYYTLDLMFSYNTGSTENNNSNIFIRYQYTSNMIRSFSSNAPNNYWQFQIGYVLDITKVFPSQPTTASTPAATDGTH